MTAVQERASEQIVRDIIKETSLPPYVTKTMFRFGTDSSGDASVTVYAIIEDRAAKEIKSQDMVLDLFTAFQPAFERINEFRVPYWRVRTESEQQEMEKEGYSDLT
jgi:hypothetical protein